MPPFPPAPLLSAGIAHEINNPNNFIFFNIPILRSYLQFLVPIADAHMARHPDMRVFNRSYEAFRADCFKLLDNIVVFVKSLENDVSSFVTC